MAEIAVAERVLLWLRVRLRLTIALTESLTVAEIATIAVTESLTVTEIAVAERVLLWLRV